jgi:hypothetical protein
MFTNDCYFPQGMRNDFQAALEQVDQAYVQEILHKRKKQQDEGTGDDSPASSTHAEGEGETPAAGGDVPVPAGDAEEEEDSWEKIKALAKQRLEQGDRAWDMKITMRLLKVNLCNFNR